MTSSEASSSSLAPASNNLAEAVAVQSRSPSPLSSTAEDAFQIRPEFVIAMHDYEPHPSNPTCLSFRAGQVIRVFTRDSSGWWDGELGGQRGWFPSNYVHTEIDPSVQGDDRGYNLGRGLAQSSSSSLSAASNTPRASQHLRQNAAAASQSRSNNESYCLPIMTPLLQALSLLQNTVRTHKAPHFQPSTAFVISSVRAILASTNTLVRDSPLLQRFPVLAEERKQILSSLASLVSQAKRASIETDDAEGNRAEVETMLRLGGQVFVVMRKFLAVAAHCGIDIPEASSMQSPGLSPGQSGQSSAWSTDFDAPSPSMSIDTPRRKTPTQQRTRSQTPSRTVLRAKSMSDLRPSRSSSDDDSDTPSHPLPFDRNKLGKPAKHAVYATLRHKSRSLSVSSTSSATSSSSEDTRPLPLPFPSGPASSTQVLESLRFTHDQYLSTIAAFIGHAHSHSRTSHASSTGHLFELVREVVELACKLLTLVEAVIVHPDIPKHRVGNLKLAKEGLYNVTDSLTESVRLLAVPESQMLSDEEEKQLLLRSATSALKAGADCVAAVKVCLNRAVGNRPVVFDLPAAGTQQERSLRSETAPAAAASSVGLRTNDEDDTIQASAYPIRRPRGDSTESEDSRISQSSSAPSEDTDITAPDEEKPVPASIFISPTPVEADLPSPSSACRTDDDGTTWEGSMKGHGQFTDLRVRNGSFTISRQPSPEPDRDPLSWMFSHDYAVEDVAYNSDGHLVGATLPALVEKMTPHDSIVDPAFSAVFFLTFRFFSSPLELVDALIARYNLVPPPDLSEEDIQLWQQRKGIPVRLRVSNFIKIWLELYWRPGVDEAALCLLSTFTRDGLGLIFPGPAQRILELIHLRHQSNDGNISPKAERSRDPGMSINPPSVLLFTTEVPRPNMTKTLLAALRRNDFASISITDFDALELARQLTIMESNLYCAIQPDEILEMGQEGAKPHVNVKAVSSLSTVITGWVAESILNEQDIKRRIVLIKFFIKVADRCTGLQNYSTPRSMLAALDSSTISRLRQTWMGVSQKYKSQLESLRRLADHSRNYHEYRTKLRNTAPPAVPFLGLYLTDVTFCREGNPSHRASPLDSNKKLLNFNKYHKLARIVQDMQRFQVTYNLKAIPEVQEYLNVAFESSRHHGDLQDLYRRSLLVEPKQPADAAPSNDLRQFFNWTSRSQPQIATT